MEDFSALQERFRSNGSKGLSALCQDVPQLDNLVHAFEKIQYIGAFLDDGNMTLFFRVSSPMHYRNISDRLIDASVARNEPGSPFEGIVISPKSIAIPYNSQADENQHSHLLKYKEVRLSYFRNKLEVIIDVFQEDIEFTDKRKMPYWEKLIMSNKKLDDYQKIKYLEKINDANN